MVHLKMAMSASIIILSTVWRFGNALGIAHDSTWAIAASLVNKKATSTDAIVLAKSKLHCLVQCRKYWNCRTISYVKSNKQCYFNPSFDVNSASAAATLVYKDTAPVCKVSDIPPIQNAVVKMTSLKQNLTSFKFDVTCLSDYRRVNNNIVPVRCLATGRWEIRTTDICKQQIFPLYGASFGSRFPIPGIVQTGWKGFFAITPTQNSRFTFDLYDSSGDILLHFDVCMSYSGFVKVTRLTSFINNVWGTVVNLADPNPPFPFVKEDPTTVTFKAIGDKKLEVFVEDSSYATWTTAYSLTGINLIVTSGDVVVTYADLWYSH